jgi:hypothetical protein
MVLDIHAQPSPSFETAYASLKLVFSGTPYLDLEVDPLAEPP